MGLFKKIKKGAKKATGTAKSIAKKSTKTVRKGAKKGAKGAVKGVRKGARSGAKKAVKQARKTAKGAVKQSGVGKPIKKIAKGADTFFGFKGLREVKQALKKKKGKKVAK